MNKLIVSLLLMLSIVSAAVSAKELPKIMYDVHEATTLISETEFTNLHEITVPDASFVKVHFKNFQVPKGVTVRVRNPEGTEVYNYSKHSKSSFTKHGNDDGVKSFAAMSITGDTAVVEVLGYNPSVRAAENRLDIDYYSAGLPNERIGELYEDILVLDNGMIESTCGDIDNKVPTPCIIDEFPLEYERMRPVARITNGGGSLCTAWRVGEANRLFTNNHCNSTQAEIAASEVWFNYEYTACAGSLATTVPVKVAGDQLLFSYHELDVALFTVQDFHLVQPFGHFGLEVREAVLGELIYRGGHGSGRPKLATIESDMNEFNGGFCQVDDASRNGFALDSDIGYHCDSIGGSSGSPVLLRENGRAIALHHLGSGNNSVCMNAGVKMSLIWPVVSSYFGGIVPNGDNDGGPVRVAPVADLQMECTYGECTFDASGSTDADGEIVAYNWDFGDGTTSTEMTGSKTYDSTGIYTVQLLVKDDSDLTGFKALENIVILEGGNLMPEPSFDYSDDNNYTVTFNSTSRDPGGEIVETCWRVRDSGFDYSEWDCGPGDYSPWMHTYQIGGRQAATIKVTDNQGDTRTYGRWITVNGPIMNESPVASFTITPVNNYDTFTFTNTSYDPDGEIVKWYWNFKNGTTSWDPGPHTITYTLPDGVSEEEHYVYTYVYDNYGVYDFEGEYITVTAPPPNQAPVADFNHTANLTEVTFTNASSDDRNDIVSWEWDFGDGNTSIEESPVHVYAAEYKTYTVSLKVTDGEGLPNTFTDSVTVDPEPVSVIALRIASGKASKGKMNLRLIWSGAPTENVSIFRDGILVGTYANDGSEMFLVKRNEKNKAYKVCEVNTNSRPNACSNTVSVSF